MGFVSFVVIHMAEEIVLLIVQNGFCLSVRLLAVRSQDYQLCEIVGGPTGLGGSEHTQQ